MFFLEVGSLKLLAREFCFTDLAASVLKQLATDDCVVKSVLVIYSDAKYGNGTRHEGKN